MKNLIKKLLKEGINEIQQNRLTVDYFKQRVPFLRDTFHEVEYDRGIQIFLDQVNHPDAKVVNKDNEIITFNIFKTGVNFNYYRGKVSGSDDVLHTFKLEPIVMADLKTDDDLFKRVHAHALRMQLDKIGVNESIQTPVGGEIPDAELDRIVNEMNKTFFVFEKFLENFGVTLNT